MPSPRPLAVLSFLPALLVAQAATPFPVRVDPRFELLSIVFRMAGAEEYSQPSSASPYASAVEAHFGKFREHAAVHAAKQVREARGIAFNSVASFAMHLAKVGETEFLVPLEPWPRTFDASWDAASARAFAHQLAVFAKDTGFEGFLAAQRPFTAAAEERLRRLLGERPYRAWIEDFFGERIDAESVAIAGLLSGGGNYGESVQYPDGRLAVTPILGIGSWDAQGLPVFSEAKVPTVVHEFCHPFANPLVDRHREELLPAARRLHARKQVAFASQAYGDAQTVLYESLVRACVVAIFEERRGPAAADAQQLAEIGHGYWFTPKWRAALARYRKERDRFPTLASFAGELGKSLGDVDALFTEFEARVPKLVKCTPAADATGLAREVAFRFEFDRPMARTSRGLAFAEGVAFEQVVPSAFDASGKVYTVTLRMAEGARVQGWLNRGGTGFAAESGHALDEVPFAFAVK